MKIYFAYGCKADEVTAYRISVLCEAHGIDAYAAPGDTREEGPVVPLEEHFRREIRKADIVFEISNRGWHPRMWQELGFASSLKKPMLGITFQGEFPANVLIPGRSVAALDPAIPSEALKLFAMQADRYFLQPKYLPNPSVDAFLTKKAARALYAVALLAVGLIMLDRLKPDEE